VGLALIETVGKEVLAQDWQQRWWTEVDGVLLLEERQLRMAGSGSSHAGS